MRTDLHPPEDVAGAGGRARWSRRTWLIVGAVALVIIATGTGIALIAAGAGSPDAAGSPSSSALPVTPSAANPGVGAADLGQATLDIPAWPPGLDCAAGRVTFRDGVAGPGGNTAIAGVALGDLDADGSAEAVATVICDVQDDAVHQLLGFDRDASGAIILMGSVIPDLGSNGWITSATVTTGGAVEAAVFILVDGAQQQRAYRWDGQRFIQTGGPTGFPPPEPAAVLIDLSVSAEPILLGPPDEMRTWVGSEPWPTRHGDLVITATNASTTKAERVSLSIRLPGGGAGILARTDWPSNCQVAQQSGNWQLVDCAVGELGPGEQRTFTYDFSTPTENDGRDLTAEGTFVMIWAQGSGNSYDPNDANNRAEIDIPIVG